MFTSPPPKIKIVDLEKRINAPTDTTYIVNFWATWCVPCVQELPDFEKINEKYARQKVKVLLVSLDFAKDADTKLVTFIKSKGIRSEVLFLNETDDNYFIPRISANWTGAIPATLIVNNSKKSRTFYEKKLNYAFLNDKILSLSK